MLIRKTVYAHLVGKKVKLPTTDREIPIIADEYVDMETWYSCVKITPAHDPNDFMGERHHLETIVIMNKDGTMNEKAGRYNGMDRYECRKEIIVGSLAIGVFGKSEEKDHAVCHKLALLLLNRLSRNSGLINGNQRAVPLWRQCSGETKFVPERFHLYPVARKLSAISGHKLWWGHRIPVWYCDDCGEVIVPHPDLEACLKCGSKHIRQDPDVLDTWFSCALAGCFHQAGLTGRLS